MSYVVLHVRPYDFEAEDGRRLRGATVTYLDLAMKGSDPECGYAPLNLSVEPDVDRQFSAVPGLYDLDFRQRRGKNGKPTLVLAGARLVSAIEFSDGEIFALGD